jgi:hypothetical protein
LGSLAGAALFGAALFGCPDKKSDGGGTSSSASTSSSVATTASASASASAVANKDDDDDDDNAGVPSSSASASAMASASASAKPTGTAVSTTAKSTATAVASANSGPAPGSCGGKDQPKCPLQAWMAANMQPAMAGGDATKLAAALRQAAKFAPAGYGDWSKIATDGAAAVDAAKDVAAGKPSCKSCHGEYQKRYRTEMRERPI